jgi:squalene cyclase
MHDEPDVLVANEGTVFLFNPLTARATEWIDEHVQDDAQWFGSTLVVEHRYAWGLAQGMKDDGLVLA